MLALATALLLATLTACGGGGSGSGGGGGGGGKVIGIAVGPTTTSLGIGENTTFTATVTNTSNTAVYWLVVEGSTGGTITSGGHYTAPNAAGTYHVLVTSQADTTKSATAVVTVFGTSTRIVTGTTVVTFHTTDTTGAFHTTDVPQNASSFTLAALVPNGSGGFTSVSGTGASDGSYSITGVPVGYFWLTDGRGTFVWTPKNTIDTGIDYTGDSTVTIGSATVSLNMTGASAWQTSDFAIFYSPNTGTYKQFFTAGTAGTTSLSDVINLTSSPLLSSTKGDYAIVYQLVHHTVTGGGYKAVERFYSQPDPFSTPSGVQTQLNAAFTSVTNNSTVHFSINASQFAAFTSLMGPGATDSSTCLALQALPSTADTGFSNVAGDVILADDCQGGTPILTDTDLGDISFGNPYPSNWPLFSEFVHLVSVPYKLSGTTTSYQATAANIVYTTTLPTIANPIVPLVGPVLNPTIAAYGSSTNSSLQSGATGVGTSPVISWQAPSVGTPAEYVVTITPLTSSSGATTAQTPKTLWVSGGVHSIQVPPGVMTAGKTYFIGISAVVGTGVNPDTESYPYRRSLPFGQTDVLSGLITP